MKQSAQWIGKIGRKTPETSSGARLSFFKFFKRYPIFLLAFGPPIFRGEGVDVTQGRLDVWSIFQVGLLMYVTAQSVLRLTTAQSVLIPKEIKSILKYAFFLFFVFFLSSLYSPSPPSSAAYSILYLCTWICIIEFIAGAYRNPPDWLQCIFQLRMIAFLLLLLVLIDLPIRPTLVLHVTPGEGIRLLGGAVASVPLICSVIAIVSAYSFLYALEPKARSLFFFLIGMAGIVVTQSRAGEISLLCVFAMLGFGWAKRSRRSAYLFLVGISAFVLLLGVAVAHIGAGRIWDTFNRGQSAAGIESASGRTDVWKFVLHYCLIHPQGMGYVAGFRIVFMQYFSLSTGRNLDKLGTAHNTLMDILAGGGWLALAIYLILITKIVWVAWRFSKAKSGASQGRSNAAQHGMRCSILLFVYCFLYGMAATEFLAPLRSGFYFQYIIMAIMLAAPAAMIAASRNSRTEPRYGYGKDFQHP